MTAIEVVPEVEVERLPHPPLMSTFAASKLAGVAWRTFPVLAENAGIEPLRTDKRVLWRRSDVIRLLGLGKEPETT